MPVYQSKVHTNTMSLLVGKYRISIIWGPLTYSDHHWNSIGINDLAVNSRKVELAVLKQPETNTSKDWVTKHFIKTFDGVAGYLSVDEVVVVIGKVALKAKDQVLLDAIKQWPSMQWIYQLRKELEVFSDSGIIDGTCRPILAQLESPK